MKWKPIFAKPVRSDTQIGAVTVPIVNQKKSVKEVVMSLESMLARRSELEWLMRDLASEYLDTYLVEHRELDYEIKLVIRS